MIAVTGATGIIGSHLTYALLKKGYKVLALTTKLEHLVYIQKVFEQYQEDFDLYKDKLQVSECDILDIWALEEQFAKVEKVYHCAASVNYSGKQSIKAIQINQDGTANVINAALSANIQKLCHVSSVAAIQNPDFRKNIHEEIIWKSSPQLSDYAISKYGAEREVWRGFEEGLEGIIINPSVVLAPLLKAQSSGQLLAAAKRGNRFYTNGSTGFVDVRDLTKMAIALMESNVSKERFILNGYHLSYQKLFSALNPIFKQKEPNISIPKWLLNVFRPIASLLNPVFSKIPTLEKSWINTAYEHISYDSNKVKTTLKLDFRTFEDTLAWIQARK
jgi:dihydroflavonol-4-reductase